MYEPHNPTRTIVDLLREKESPILKDSSHCPPDVLPRSPPGQDSSRTPPSRTGLLEVLRPDRTHRSPPGQDSSRTPPPRRRPLQRQPEDLHDDVHGLVFPAERQVSVGGLFPETRRADMDARAVLLHHDRRDDKFETIRQLLELVKRSGEDLIMNT